MVKCLIALVCGFFFPGAGHYYLGLRRKAFLFASVVLICFGLGLCLDLDYYYRYQDIKKQVMKVRHDPSKPADRILASSFIDPIADPKLRFDEIWLNSPSSSLVLKGHTRSGLVLEAFVQGSEKSKVQTIADYKGHFVLPPLSLSLGENQIVYAASNEYRIPGGENIHVADYDAVSRYQPGTLYKIWFFIYQVVFPALITPPVHIGGSLFQGQVLSWWEKMPLVEGEKSIPAPLRDVGFYLIVLAAMINLIILFDAFDTCYNREILDDLP